MAVEETAEFVQQYVSELEDLTFNSKAIINTLTMLAGENKQAASGVADAIEKRILTVPNPLCEACKSRLPEHSVTDLSAFTCSVLQPTSFQPSTC